MGKSAVTKQEILCGFKIKGKLLQQPGMYTEKETTRTGEQLEEKPSRFLAPQQSTRKADKSFN